MKRDIEYQIGFLKEVEERETALFVIHDLKAKKANDEKAKHWYHLRLLIDAELITRLGNSKYYRLTSKGHDYLDQYRNNNESHSEAA